MDRKKLAIKLERFKKACEAKGYPLMEVYAEEAFPGVKNSSFTIKAAAAWAEEKGYSKSLDILIDALWETFSQKERVDVFAINVFRNPEELHRSVNKSVQAQQLEMA